MGAPAVQDYQNATMQIAKQRGVPASQIIETGRDLQGRPMYGTINDVKQQILEAAQSQYNILSPADRNFAFAKADPNSFTGYSIGGDPIGKETLDYSYIPINNYYVPIPAMTNNQLFDNQGNVVGTTYNLLDVYKRSVNPLTGNANYNPNNAYTNQLNAFTNLLSGNTGSYRPAYSSESYMPVYNTTNPASDYASSQGSYDAGSVMGNNYSVGYDTTNY